MGQTLTVSATWHKHLTHCFWDMPLLVLVTSFKMVALLASIWIFAENSLFANTVGTYLFTILRHCAGETNQILSRNDWLTIGPQYKAA